MLNVRFNLRDPQQSITPINIVLRWSGERLVYPSGEKINSKDWNNEKQRSNSSNQSFELNTRLEKLRDKIQNEFRRLINDSDQKIPTRDELRKALDLCFKESETKALNLMSFIEQYIKESETRVNPITGKPIAKSTINSYKRIEALLKDFRRSKRPLDFKDIDLDFYHDFNSFMIKSKNFIPNTRGKHIKTLIGILNEATERGHNENLAFKSKRFKATSETVNTIYLNRDEIADLRALDLSKNKRLDNARDLFLVGYYTGLRFSDFSDLRKAKIEKGVIKVKAQKTQKDVVIPVLPELQAIFEKYSNEQDLGLPQKISNPKLNEYIKEVCAMIPSLQKPIEIVQRSEGREVYVKAPKYTQVTTHTARRSFATNAYEMGVPTISIRAITQHKTDKDFMKYIRASSDTHAEILLNTWNNQRGSITEIA